MNQYPFIYEGGEGEIEEKKSRFIAHIEKIQSEQDALDFIARIKKKYWDARHNCFAYVAGPNQELQRCSDDGEPSGTAGRPMLDVLLRENIHNCVAVVTRYFGGTLLGTGGLVRAYQKSLQEGLANSTILIRQEGIRLVIHTDYNGLGKIQYLLGREQIAILDSQYTDTVDLTVMVPSKIYEHLITQLTECTNGTARFDAGDTLSYAVQEGTLILLEPQESAPSCS